MAEDKLAKQLKAAKALVTELAGKLDLDAHVRLWDGTRLPLGRTPPVRSKSQSAIPASSRP